MAVNASVTVGTSNVGLASGKVLIFRISSINSSYRPFTLSGTSATPVSTVVADSGTILYCCYICTNPKGKYSSGSDAVTVYYIPLT
jgi:hypothetical protein